MITVEQKLALIRAHPDLAGRAAIAGELTKESSEEQRSASLDQCTEVEFKCFQLLNSHYKEKFGFPFVGGMPSSYFSLGLDPPKRRPDALSVEALHSLRGDKNLRILIPTRGVV